MIKLICQPLNDSDMNRGWRRFLCFGCFLRPLAVSGNFRLLIGLSSKQPPNREPSADSQRSRGDCCYIPIGLIDEIGA